MLTPIEATATPPVSPLVATILPVSRSEPPIDIGRAGTPADFYPASLTQKASVAKVSIDPAVEEPRKLLKPFGIEMWTGPPAADTAPAEEKSGDDINRIEEVEPPVSLKSASLSLMAVADETEPAQVEFPSDALEPARQETV